jgi:hypothetical protein
VADLALGALRAQIELDAAGLEAGVKKAIGGLNAVESAVEKTAQKTEDVGKTLQKALKGEVLVNAMNRIASSLGQMGGQFEVLSKAAQGAGAIMQGLFQGGALGAGIAAAGVAVASVAQAFADAENNSRRVNEMWAKDLQARVDQLAVIQGRISDIGREIAAASGISAAAGVASATGLSLGSAQQFAALDQAEIRKSRAQERFGYAERGARGGGDLAQHDLKIASAELEEASSALLKLESQLQAQTDVEIASAKEREGARREAERAQKQRMFGDALKQARAYAPDGLRTPGEEVRLAAEAEAFGSDGNTRREAADRAARDAGYAANASETLVLDAPLRRITETFAEAAEYVTGGVLDSIRTFADDFADAMETAADVAGQATQEVWARLAPKTFDVVEKVLSGDIAGAIASALSHSIELQAVGKALDQGLVDVVNALTEVLRPAVPVITMAVRAVVEAFKIVGDLLQILMSISGMDQVFALVFEAVKFLAAALSAGAVATQWALDALANNFKKGAIAFLSMFGDTFKSQIADLTGSLVAQGDLGGAVAKAFNDVMSIGFNAEMAAVGMGDAAAAADKVAQSFLNLPAGFKTAAAIYGATGASSAPFGGFMPPPVAAQLPGTAGATGGGPSGGGDVFNFYGPIYVSGDEEFTNVVTVSARQSGMAASGTTGGRPPPQRPTPYAPNATQPYTPASP